MFMTFQGYPFIVVVYSLIYFYSTVKSFFWHNVSALSMKLDVDVMWVSKEYFSTEIRHGRVNWSINTPGGDFYLLSFEIFETQEV